MPNYLASCCGHSVEGHLEEPSDYAGECCESFCQCKQSDSTPLSVLEAMNKHYGTALTITDLEYRNNPLGNWSHNVTTSPYGKSLVISLTSSNDVHGYDDPMTTANHSYLQELWGEYEALEDAGYSNCRAIALNWDKPAPADLFDVLKSLEDYPALDEEEMSRLEIEWIDEGWDDYGLCDALHTLEKLLSDNGFEFDLDSDVLKEELRQDICRDDETNPPYWETGGGAVFHSDKIVPAMYDKYLFGLKMSQPWDEPTK